MENSNRKSFAVQLAEANNTVEAKGLVLSRWDKSITKGDISRFKKLCEFGGFWFTLGEILVKLRTESGGSRTDSALLKNANLHTVAKQRRSEAMKFFENFHVIVENDLLGKKSSICHMKDLLKAVDKIVNPKVEEEPVLEATIVADEPEALAIEDKSSNEPKAPMSASDIALEALVQCELNGVSKAKFLSALKEQLEMLDESTDKSVMQAVA
tara:strand:+ start:1166 stop:1801 length:636 start_codon:yes stop_codon:yes gene_type:complete